MARTIWCIGSASLCKQSLQLRPLFKYNTISAFIISRGHVSCLEHAPWILECIFGALRRPDLRVLHVCLAFEKRTVLSSIEAPGCIFKGRRHTRKTPSLQHSSLRIGNKGPWGNGVPFGWADHFLPFSRLLQVTTCKAGLSANEYRIT